MSQLQDLAPHDRPREKLARIGAAALGDNELLAIVIGHGRARAGALALADRVLAHCGGVRGLTRVTALQLARVPLLGPVHAARILAAVELGRRTLLRAHDQRERFKSPREIAEFLLPTFGARPVEHFGVLLLDVKHRPLRTAIITVGTLDASVILPRDVFREAALSAATSVVVFHNHPSGDPSPSPEDAAITKRMVSAGQLLGIEVIDHLILADARYYSFREADQQQRGMGPPLL